MKKDNALIEDIIREMNDSEKRKNNFIIFRARELNTNVKQERIAYDLKVVKESGTNIGITITEEDVIRTSRLGKNQTKYWNAHTVHNTSAFNALICQQNYMTS